jgi:hypothetical protein
MGSNLSDEALKSLGELDDSYRRLDSTQTNLTNSIGHCRTDANKDGCGNRGMIVEWQRINEGN